MSEELEDPDENLRQCETVWGNGEVDLVGWVVVCPFQFGKSIGLIVEDPSTNKRRLVFFDKRNRTLRSVKVIDGRVSRDAMTAGLPDKA